MTDEAFDPWRSMNILGFKKCGVCGHLFDARSSPTADVCWDCEQLKARIQAEEDRLATLRFWMAQLAVAFQKLGDYIEFDEGAKEEDRLWAEREAIINKAREPAAALDPVIKKYDWKEQAKTK